MGESKPHDGTERRDSRRSLADIEDVFERMLRDHELREKAQLTQMIADLKIEAFPDSAEKHREAHQAMIDAAKSQEDFWRGLKVDIAKKSIWGILHILTLLVVAGLAAKFGFGSIVAGALPK